MALANFVRLSLRKAAYVVVASAARQEIWVRFGRDDKGEGDASKEGGCWTEGVFHHLGWAAGPITTPVEMTILFGNATHRFQATLSSRPERTQISYLVTLTTATHATFRRERRTELGNATKFHRKSGGA